jgi:hypothetical protein
MHVRRRGVVDDTTSVTFDYEKAQQHPQAPLPAPVTATPATAAAAAAAAAAAGAAAATASDEPIVDDDDGAPCAARSAHSKV